MALCINCSILLRSNLQLYEYWAIELSPELVLIAEEWCGRDVTILDRVCHECVMLVAREAENRMDSPYYPPNKQLGHTCVCIYCGISLGRRHHRHHERSEQMNYIANEIFPRQVPDEAYVCHHCWMRARHVEPDNIVLPSSEPVSPSLHDVQQPSPQQLEVVASMAPSSNSVTMPSSETDSWAASVQPDQDTSFG